MISFALNSCVFSGSYILAMTIASESTQVAFSNAGSRFSCVKISGNPDLLRSNSFYCQGNHGRKSIG